MTPPNILMILIILIMQGFVKWGIGEMIELEHNKCILVEPIAALSARNTTYKLPMKQDRRQELDKDRTTVKVILPA